jgi:hypothetical protein
MDRYPYRVKVLTPAPPQRKKKANLFNPTGADRSPRRLEGRGVKARREMWNWCLDKDCRAEIRQHKTDPWSVTYCFRNEKDAEDFRAKFKK